MRLQDVKNRIQKDGLHAFIDKVVYQYWWVPVLIFQAASKAIRKRDSFQDFPVDQIPVEIATRYKYDLKTEVRKPMTCKYEDDAVH